MRQLASVLIFLLGLALFATPQTAPWALAAIVSGLVMYGRGPWRLEDAIVGWVMIIGAAGALALIASYFIPLP